MNKSKEMKKIYKSITLIVIIGMASTLAIVSIMFEPPKEKVSEKIQEIESKNEQNKESEEDITKKDIENLETYFANEKHFSDVPGEQIVEDKFIDDLILSARKGMYDNFERAYLNFGDSLMKFNSENKDDALSLYADMARYFSLSTADRARVPSIVKNIRDPQVFAMALSHLEEDELVTMIIDPLSHVLPERGAKVLSVEEIEFDFNRAKGGTLGFYSEIYRAFDHELVPPREDDFKIFKANAHLKITEGFADFEYYIVQIEGTTHIYGMYAEDLSNLIGMVKTKQRIEN